MKYKLLGKSGLRVSELCLGTMTFGEDWGWGASKEVSNEIFDTYVDKGGNFVDTANKYTNGTSEKYVGEFVNQDRERFVVSTKYSLNMNPGDPNAGGNHRKNIIQSVSASLKRLNLGYIDLYWLHAWDFMTPIEEVMRALDDQVKKGKILYIGISDAPAWIIARANAIAEYRGWTPFIAMQMQYSLIQRSIEREFLPMAKELDMTVTAWSPLGGGVLTGKYNKKSPEIGTSPSGRLKPDSLRLTERNLAIAKEVNEIASETDSSPSAVAIKWIQGRWQRRIIPILGARTTSQINQNLDCLDLKLTNHQIKTLNEVSKIELGFPYDFLTSQSVIDILYGGTLGSIETKTRSHFSRELYSQ
ncbi:MAG: aldo/keto reductase [Candidatus Hodarchaeales archaeon]